MKKFFVLMFLTFLFLANAYGELQVRGPSVIATTESVEGQDSYVTEIYYWDTKSESYKLEDAYFAHIGLRVHVNVFAVGKGYFSLFSNGDLHKYSAIYHPPNETPNHVAALIGDSKTRVKVGSGWPWIIFSGLKSERVTAGGTLKTTTTGKYEIKVKASSTRVVAEAQAVLAV